MSKLAIFADLFAFLRIRKKWWLLPLILLIVLLGIILVFEAHGAGQSLKKASFIFHIR